MANSKARSRNRSASERSAGSPVRRQRPNGRGCLRHAHQAGSPTAARAAEPAVEDELVEEQEPGPSGQPLWLQVTSFVLAILGLAISAYETYAHFNGSHLAGCPTGGNGTFNCTAVITSSQSMVFGVIPVAVLGLAFYVAAVPLFSPWAWRIRAARGAPCCASASVIVGMGFVMYLIYAELPDR